MRVIVGCPTNKAHRHCIDRFCNAVKALTYKDKEVVFFDDSDDEGRFAEIIRRHGFRVIEQKPLSQDIPHRIADNKNAAINHAVKAKADYLLLLDTDVIVPEDTIERLLGHNKPIVTGAYLTAMVIGGKRRIVPCLFGFGPEPELLTYLPLNAVMKSQLMQVKGCGLGCCLVKTEVFEKARPHIEDQSSEDLPFCRDAQAAGYEIWADTGIKAVHIKEGENLDWPAAVAGFSFSS